MKKILFLLLMGYTLQSKCQVKTQPDLWALSNQYLNAFEARDFERMGTFLHDSVSFFDIGSKAEGKANVISNWKKTFDPLPERIHFDIREHFVSGNFVVLDLFYEAVTMVDGKKVLVNIEVVSVLQFKDWKIILLHDYPDLTSYARQWGSQLPWTKVAENPNRVDNVAGTLQYYEAYGRWDVPKMSSFYHDSITFMDLTAKDTFKGGKFEHQGKGEVTQFWSGIFGNTPLEYVSMTVHNTFTAGDYVVANTTLSLLLPPSWTGNAPGKVYVSLPIKTLLRFKDGKIISQFDFADYATYNKQIEIQLPSK